MPRLFLLIPTHTTRHLDSCIAALARQTRMPHGIVVACDTDDPAIGTLLDGLWPRVAHALCARNLAPPVLLQTSRPRQDAPRLNQNRNNGLRALDAHFTLRDDDRILVIDGDTILEERGIERHAARSESIILAYRINLDAARTNALGPDRLLDPSMRLDGLATPAELADLAVRQRRLERQARLRASPFFSRFLKRHKPKLLGGHHAVRVGSLRAVNGYDEFFRGDGTDDDDLARRLYQLRPLPSIAVLASSILAFHLYHDTRRPWRPTQAPDYARFARPNAPTSAERGWNSPLPQPEPIVRVIAP